MPEYKATPMTDSWLISHFLASPSSSLYPPCACAICPQPLFPAPAAAIPSSRQGLGKYRQQLQGLLFFFLPPSAPNADAATVNDQPVVTISTVSAKKSSCFIFKAIKSNGTF